MITFAEPATISNSKPRSTPTLNDLLRRVEGEYHEMPGLCLTRPQAERLWGLDRATCAIVLATLVDRQVLRRTAVGLPSRTKSRGAEGATAS
jgi:hypothetical protein